MSDVRALFVCYGNTCRSPLAEGIFRDKVARAGLSGRFEVDSAGTHAPGAGGPPHPLSRAVAARHRLDVDALRARRFEPADFDRFDRIVALDAANMADLVAQARDERDHAKIRLLRGADGDVADPIFGGTDEHYERAFAEIDEACEHLLVELRAELR